MDVCFGVSYDTLNNLNHGDICNFIKLTSLRLIENQLITVKYQGHISTQKQNKTKIKMIRNYLES